MDEEWDGEVTDGREVGQGHQRRDGSVPRTGRERRRDTMGRSSPQPLQFSLVLL